MLVLHPYPRSLKIGDKAVFHLNFAAFNKLRIAIGCLSGLRKVPAIFTDREPHVLFRRPIRATCAPAATPATYQRLWSVAYHTRDASVRTRGP
jgi:hypothetical protein